MNYLSIFSIIIVVVLVLMLLRYFFVSPYNQGSTSLVSLMFIIMLIVLVFFIIRYAASDPYTLLSLQDGKTTSVISASSLSTNGTGVPSSNFAYSVWFYINDWNYRYGEDKVIFGRMGSNSRPNEGSISGINGVDPCPAVILGAVENNINVTLGCFPGADEQPTTAGGNTIIHTCNVSNIPIQKWVNLAVSVYGRSMDIYINGKLVRTCLLPGVASVNNNSNIYVTPLGGFDGFTSKFQYFPNSINPQEAWDIYTQGYGGSGFGLMSFLNDYGVKISLEENGVSKGDISF